MQLNRYGTTACRREIIVIDMPTTHVGKVKAGWKVRLRSYINYYVVVFSFVRIDHRYNERVSEPWQRGPSSANAPVSSGGVGSSKTNYGSNGSGNTMLGNGVGLSSNTSWSGNGSTQQDRWSASSSSLMPVGRSMASSGSFNNNWTGSAPPLSGSTQYNPATGNIGSLNNPVIGQSGSVGYSADRYSRH